MNLVRHSRLCEQCVSDIELKGLMSPFHSIFISIICKRITLYNIKSSIIKLKMEFAINNPQLGFMT